MVLRFLASRLGLWLMIALEFGVLFGTSRLLADRGWTDVVAGWVLITAFYYSNNRAWRWFQRAAASRAGHPAAPYRSI